ncbi:MAG: pyridoxine 5'-phosphate synthase [Phycisphaerae bacterium]
MAKLGVNIDHVATVRQARRTIEPDPVWAATEAQLGGADGITFHLREDRRHINDRDAALLKQTVTCKLNMEMSIAPSIVRIAEDLRPNQCTLVPERRQELTTEGGLDVIRFKRRIAPVVGRLHRKGIEVSAFIEPIIEQVKMCADLDFDAIELWTGGYAHARGARARRRSLKQLETALELGWDRGLVVHGGHGLTYDNIGPVAEMEFEEFNIGHSIVARAIFVGMREAVRQMKVLAMGVFQ